VTGGFPTDPFRPPAVFSHLSVRRTEVTLYDPSSVALYYTHLFPARNDVYSRWTPKGWRPLREPLTPAVALAGLTGEGPSISGYMIAPPGVSHTVAIDFDRDDGMEQGLRLSGLMWSEEMPNYVESSRRGSHLWMTLDEVAPAKVIRTGMRGLIQRLGLDPHDPKIELRPGTDTVAEDGLGHALRLPFMPHPKTGKRGTLMGQGGKVVSGTLATTLLEWPTAPAAKLYDWAERYKPPPLRPDQMPKSGHNPHEPFPEDDSLASDILRELWGCERAMPGRSVKCPAHEDKLPSLSILRDDKRAICKAPHCVLNNNDRGRGTYELRQLAAPHDS
jgi:hypothetical protein